MDRGLHWCSLRVLLGGITLISFIVQTSASTAAHKVQRPPGQRHKTAPALLPHLSGFRYLHAECACCVLQTVPSMTLDPLLVTNSKTRSSTERLLRRRLATSSATASHHSGWSILEAAIEDDPDVAAFVSFAFLLRMYRPPMLEVGR